VTPAPLRPWLAALAVATACTGGDDFSYTGISAQVMPMTFEDVIPHARVTFGGSLERDTVLDTGSPLTIVNTPYYPGLTDGKHEDDIAVMGIVVPRYTYAAWNFADGVSGIVGGDILRHFDFTIDYKGGRGLLSDPFDVAQLPADVSTAAAVEVPFDLSGHGRVRLPGVCDGDCGSIDVPATRILMQARFEGQADPIYVVVDTGATELSMDPQLISALGDVLGRPRLDGYKVGTVYGPKDAFETRVWRLTLLGNNPGVDPTVSVDDVPGS